MLMSFEYATCQAIAKRGELLLGPKSSHILDFLTLGHDSPSFDNRNFSDPNLVLSVRICCADRSVARLRVITSGLCCILPKPPASGAP